MNKRILFIVQILFLFFVTSLVAQNEEHIHSEKCGHNILMEAMENQFPGYQNLVEHTFRKAKEKGPDYNRSSSVYTIDVVVHVVWKEAEENISDQIIQDQIDVLNEDFRALNADFANLRTEFGSIAADPMIEFNLVAIERVQTTETFSVGLFTGFEDHKLKNSANGGSSPYDTNTHLNIWVCNIQPSIIGLILGLAYPPVNLSEYPDLNNFPPGASPADEEYNGVVIHYPAFGGRDRTATIEGLGSVDFEGRTTVHEVGHYLGLAHIWGNALTILGEDGCMSDDGIDDTPNAGDSSQAIGCEPTKNTCIDEMDDLPDMWENYMDYSLEACQVTFTQGQVDLMRAILEGPRATLIAGQVSNTEIDILNSQVAVAPNPTNGIVNLDVRFEDNDAYDVIVRDMLGRQIGTMQSYQGNEIIALDLSNETNGVYFVEIQKGVHRIAKKVVVTK